MSAPKQPDLENIKRSRLKDGIMGQETTNQVEHVRSAGVRAVLGQSGVLVAGDVIASDTSAAGVKVFAGTICRIQVSADTYVAFGDDDLGAVDVNTSPALKLAAGYWLVTATANYIRTSTNVTRLEIISK